jgi:hypothetical protein
VSEREQFLQNALAAWNDYHSTSLHITGEEADAWMESLEVGEDASPPQLHE